MQQMIQPTIGIFTHLGDAHGENFASKEEKLAEKAQLFTSCQWVIGQTGEALEYIKTRVPSTTSFLLWGEDPKADIHVKTMDIALGHREVQVTFGNKHFILDIPFPDIASYENCMNAVSILLLKQYSPNVIISRVQQLSAIAMRMEIKDGINNCTLVNDYYNSDPSSFQLALYILATQDASKERVVILSDFMDTGKSGDDLYPSIAETLRQANISLFIGIGKHLSEHRHDFAANSRFYEDTEHFLRQEERDNFNNQIILIKGARAFQLEYIAGFLQKQSHSTILEVDLDAMVHNLNHFRSLTDAHIAVMVKAFSYGSGSREIASLLQYHRVDYLMVAFADEGIDLEIVQFSDYVTPNNALANGDIDLNAFQHRIYLQNEIDNYGYAIQNIGNTFIIPLNLYSQKVSSVDELKDGDVVAIPDDLTNGGRALKVLEAAGLIELDPNAAFNPTLDDITSYKVNITIEELKANTIPSVLPDVAAAVVNGNYALDFGLKTDEAIYKDSVLDVEEYWNLIAARTADVEDPDTAAVYEKVVEAFQSSATEDVFNNTFGGYFIAVGWDQDLINQ